MEDRNLYSLDLSSTEQKASLILVVDDEPNMCNALQRILSTEGYRVQIALDGKTALRLVEQEKPDLVLLDIMMPGMNGNEVCQKVREVCDSRIIYFTARSDLARGNKNGELNTDADGFIPKPSSSRKILSVVDFALNKKID